MEEKVKQAWENFLDPAKLRASLIVSSLFITSYEILKETIISRPRDLFTNGFDENGDSTDPKYNQVVLSLNKSPIYASLEWLKEMGAINENDISIFTKIKSLRNEIAHEMPEIIFKGTTTNPISLFTNLIELIDKIEGWWIREVEIPTDPDLFDQEIDYEKIVPGKIMTMRLLLDIALGSEKESEFYYNEFLKHAEKTK
ncbi:MAG: hypothetical protein KQI62_19070 [Deltaproteobacteria bacterium]|nr:hypothetical protein [Deltaproteobacteria bacterium]